MDETAEKVLTAAKGHSEPRRYRMGHGETHQTLHGYFNQRNFDAMDDHMRADMTYEDIPRGLSLTNRDEFKGLAAGVDVGFLRRTRRLRNLPPRRRLLARPFSGKGPQRRGHGTAARH